MSTDIHGGQGILGRFWHVFSLQFLVYFLGCGFRARNKCC